jgi:hypothetical protein
VTLSWDNEILSSTRIGISNPYVQEIIGQWLEYEVKSGARHCTECFLTRVIVHELRKKLNLEKGVSVNVNDLEVKGGRCDFKIQSSIEPDYEVEIKKSLAGQHRLVKEMKETLQHKPNSNPFLLIYLSVLEQWKGRVEGSLEGVKNTCGSSWELSPSVKLPNNGFAVLAKNMSKPPYIKPLK